MKIEISVLTRRQWKNSSLTIRKLLDWNVLPIINQNDSISNEELRYGDNDTLSALVASAVSADQLILLTDVDRLYSADPKTSNEAEPISDVHNHKDLQKLNLEPIQSLSWGTGGVKTKLAAARIATATGITVQLADGRDPQILGKLLNGGRGGTVFHPSKTPLGNRKSWLAHALQPLGSLYLDNGACDAIRKRGAALLLVGVKNIDGDIGAKKILELNK